MSVAALDVLIVAFRLSDVERGYPSGYLAAEIYRQGMEPDPASWYDWHGNIPVRTKPELICGTCVDDFEYDDGSYAPSLIAIEHGHKDVLQALIQVGAVVAARAPHLVHLAVSSERLGCVKVPVQAGADFFSSRRRRKHTSALDSTINRVAEFRAPEDHCRSSRRC